MVDVWRSECDDQPPLVVGWRASGQAAANGERQRLGGGRGTSKVDDQRLRWLRIARNGNSESGVWWWASRVGGGGALWSVARRLSIRRPGCPDELIFARSAWSRALTGKPEARYLTTATNSKRSKGTTGQDASRGRRGGGKDGEQTQGAGKGAAGDGRSGRSEVRHQCCGRHVQDALVVMIASRRSRG